MSSARRVQQSNRTRFAPWHWLTSLHRPRIWKPGADRFHKYSTDPGHPFGAGFVLTADGTDIWATSDIRFDRKFWRQHGYRHPLSWVKEPPPSGIRIGTLQPGESVTFEFRESR